MLSYFVRRLLTALGTLVVVSIIAFAIIQLPPGDYVDAYAGILESMGDVVTEAVAGQALAGAVALVVQTRPGVARGRGLGPAHVAADVDPTSEMATE